MMMKKALLRLVVVQAVAWSIVSVQAQEAVRPEVGKPLQAAQALIKSGKYRDALNKVKDADAVGGKTANETTLVERMRMAAASGAGDADTAAKSFEALGSAGKLSGAERVRMAESIAGTYYRGKEYGKAMQWINRYFKEGGNSGTMRTLLIQSQYLSGDFAGAAKELTAEVQGAEKSGSAPGEDRLKLLLNAAVQLKDNNTYVYAVEKLVTYYPKKEYWVDLLSRMQRKQGFSSRLALDAYRLSLATGSMTAASDFMEMAQLSLQAGYPAEAKKVVEQGFAAGVLGAAGGDAERHGRLRDLVLKRYEEAKKAQADTQKAAMAEKDGTALIDVGLNQVFDGAAAKGISVMQQGIAKGNLKRPDDAKLHLGVAYALAGDRTKALAQFKGVGGADGTADLARLWSLQARRKN
jgi:hypothetical protein